MIFFTKKSNLKVKKKKLGDSVGGRDGARISKFLITKNPKKNQMFFFGWGLEGGYRK